MLRRNCSKTDFKSFEIQQRRKKCKKMFVFDSTAIREVECFIKITLLSFCFFLFYFIFSALLLFLFPWKQGKMSATLLPIKFKWWKIRSWLLVEWGHEFYQHVRIRLPSLSSAALFSTERQFVMFFFWNIIFFEVPKVKAWRNILFFINILIHNRCSNLTT